MARPRWFGRRTARLVLGVFLLIDVGLLGTDAYLLHSRGTTTVVDLDDALATFHHTGAGGRAAANSSGSSTPAGGVEGSGATGDEPTTAVTAASTTAPGATDSSPVPTSAPATPKAGALAPPQAGVYHYRTSGGESVSLLGASHSYPADTYAVVRQTGGCHWQIEAQVIKEHVDRREMCSDGQHLLQSEQQRTISFFGSTDGANIDCAPPQVQFTEGDAAGATTTAHCGDGKGMDALMVSHVLATGSTMVGGVTVPTVTFRIDATMTGRVRGTSSDIYTVVASSGLAISLQRTVDTLANAFGATIRYQEHVQFDLVSLTPQT